MRHLLFILFCFTSVTLQAQSLEDADKLYADKQFVAAAEMYFQLYYYEKTVDSYQKQVEFLKKKKKQQEADALTPLIKQAERLAKMVSRCEDVQIIDSIIVDKDVFLKAYLLSEEAGTIQETNGSVLYENQLKDRHFFGKKEIDQPSRLYSQIKIQSDWSEAKLLNIPTDTLGDDAFPFFMPDGLTMYYASTGNGSIGGYDIFVSRYNLNGDSYLAPTQLGMPFNSVYNDYLYAIDEFSNIGYFATDRFQPENKVIIYTFIPNETYISLEGTETPDLVNKAKITSIRDTWHQGVDYQAYLEKIKTNINNKPIEIKKDFTFVINDNTVYYTLSDFKSDAAKKSFFDSNNIREQITTIENELEIQRQDYSKGNNATKQSLKSTIPTNETRLENLYTNYKKTVTEARNLEIKYLKTKN